MKIYLAGSITHWNPRKQKENILRFYRKAEELRELGHDVYNPVEHEPVGKKNAFYYAFDLTWIHKNKPEAIYVMKGWERSLGTLMEINTGELNGIQIIYER